MDIETIGKKIRQIRKKKGITQEQLANLTGLSTMSIRRYEGGERIINDETLQRIADALEVSVWVLMDYDTAVQFKEKLINERISQLSTGVTVISQDAVQVAKDYDELDVWGKKHVRVTLDLEKERVNQQQGGQPTPVEPPTEGPPEGE